MKRRILAMVLALVMAFALLTVASAADVKTAVELNNAVAAGGEVKLTGNITASITIPAGTTVTLDLNGYTLTNEAGEDTITVANGATLVVTGNGTVDNVSHGKAALKNLGTATLNGGSYTRSAEASSSNTASGGNSYYTIDNRGTLALNKGVVVKFSDSKRGYFSSLILTRGATAKTTVDGATLTSGFIALKADENGTVNIKSGSITGDDQAVQAWGTVNVTGGTLNGDVYAWAGNFSPEEVGKVTISDGAVVNGNVAAVQYKYNGAESTTPAQVSITGGTVTGKVLTGTSGYAPNEMPQPSAKAEVSGGNFGTPVDEKYLTVNVELKKADGTYSYFGSVDEAVAAAEYGDEVVILDKAAGATYCTVTLVTSEFGETLASSTFEAKKGDTVILPALADKSGHEFAGWYTDILAGEPVGTLTTDTGYTYVVTDNVTLYARWAYDGGIIVPIIPTIGGSSFTDVPGSAYYKTAVDWAVSKGIASGTSAKTFSPDAACTRGQAVTFIWRAAGSPAPKSTVNPFTDVKATDYCYDAVLWAVEQGITNGTTATTFSPEKACTRGEIVTLLYRASGSPAGYAANSGYVDVSAKSYCATAVSWAVALRITTGTSINTFSPDAACTRAQIVTFLYRAAR